MKTNIIKKSTIAIIAIILGIIMPQNTYAQVPTPEEIKQQVKQQLGVSPQVSPTIGHCPNCGGELTSYTDVNNRREVTDQGWKCQICGRKYSNRHTCETFTPEEYSRGIRRCILVERIPINGNPDMETLVLSNYCITFNTFKCYILDGDRVIRDNIIIEHGGSYRENLPKNCRVVVKKMPTQRGDSRTRQ